MIPIVNGIVQGSAFVKDLVVQIAQAIYNYAILPLGELSVLALRSISENFTKVIKVISETGSMIAQTVRDAFHHLSGFFIFEAQKTPKLPPNKNIAPF